LEQEKVCSLKRCLPSVEKMFNRWMHKIKFAAFFLLTSPKALGFLFSLDAAHECIYYVLKENLLLLLRFFAFKKKIPKKLLNTKRRQES
jgi:hypothetical protein